EVHDLPVQLALDLMAHPPDQVGDVPRALVPVGNLGSVPPGHLVLQLVEGDRRTAAREEDEGEGVVLKSAGLVRPPGAVGALALEDVLCALLVPVGRSEVLQSAGDADSLDAVKRVKRLGIHPTSL